MRRRDAGLAHRSLGEGGITLVEGTAAITIVGIVLALLVPAFTHSARIRQVIVCRGHLKTLYEAQLKAPAPGPKEFGRAYWERLAQPRRRS
jgi:type II secretory pathway pseudopilin PulG